MKKNRLVQKFGGNTALESVSFVGWVVEPFFSSTLRFRGVHIPELREGNLAPLGKKNGSHFFKKKSYRYIIFFIYF